MAIIKLKDIRHGDCWMYCGDKAPDRRPAVTTYYDEGEPPGKPDDWDDYGLPRPGDYENPESYIMCNGDRPVELLEHYGISPTPRPLRLKRKDLIAGDCFQYLNDGDDGKSPSGEHVVEGRDISYTDMPSHWLVSTSGSARTRMNDPVRRIEYWGLERKPFVANPPETVILPCIDPFKDLRDAIFVLEVQHVDGIAGKDCLQRFERAQQTETLAATRMPTVPGEARQMVCTNAECGLTHKQIEHARLLWTYTLRLKVVERAAADAERERTRVVVDFDDV